MCIAVVGRGRERGTGREGTRAGWRWDECKMKSEYKQDEHDSGWEVASCCLGMQATSLFLIPVR